MKKRKDGAFVFAFVLLMPYAGTAPGQVPDVPKDALKETRDFLQKSPELKAWVEKTAVHLEKETAKLAKEVKEISSDDAFRLADEIKKGTKPEKAEREKRQRQAVADIVAYAGNAERHLLALLAAAGIQDSPAVRKRVQATPAFSFFVLTNHASQNIATTFIDKHAEKDGVLKVQSVKTGFGSLAFRAKTTAHTITHELAHIVLQGWDNEANDGQLPLPENIADKPMWKYKPYQRVRGGDLLAEGFAELTTQRALALTGEMSAGATYINQVGSAALMCGVDRAALTEWFAGALTSRQFSERFEAALKKRLLEKAKVKEEAAARGARILTNYALDSCNPFQGIMGRVTDPANTLSAYLSTMRANGIDDLALLRAQLPAHIHYQFPSIRPKK